MGGEAKVTVMVLKVNLGCKKCYRKIKKVLCSTPQIQDQLFDEKSDTVTISVICCTPEKVADKISNKAGRTIKGIDVKKSQPPAKPPGDKVPPPLSADKPKQGQPQFNKPQQAAGNPDKPKKVDFVPIAGPPPQQQQQQQLFQPGPPPQQAPKLNQPAPFMSPEPFRVAGAGYPSIFPPVVQYDGGPHYQNQGMSAMAPPQRFPQNQWIYQYDGYTGRSVVDTYFSEEKPSSCSVM